MTRPDQRKLSPAQERLLVLARERGRLLVAGSEIRSATRLVALGFVRWVYDPYEKAIAPLASDEEEGS